MRRQRPQYKSPRQPWESNRIKEENTIVKGYGLANKKEILKTAMKLRNWREQAKKIISLIGDEQEEKRKILINSMAKFGVVKEDASAEEVLALTLKDILERRLQTIVYRKGLARTVKQARQFIVHNKVVINARTINSPSYLVKITDDVQFVEGFVPKTTIERPMVTEETETPAEVVEVKE